MTDKQSSKQDALKPAIEHAISIWKTSAMSINQTVKLSAKQYKVAADELAGYVSKYVSNKGMSK